MKRIALLSVLLAGWLCAPAIAQFGPANVVVNEVIERPVAPVQTFVASVAPLRKSIVGTAVNGRVDEFLPHSTPAYGKWLLGAEGRSAGYQVRLARLPNIAATGEDEDAALASIAEKLEQFVDQVKSSGSGIPWTENSSPPDEGDQEHWILYRPDETKLIQVFKGQPLAQLRVATIKIQISVAAAQRDLRRAEYDEAVQTHEGLVAESEARLEASRKRWQFASNQYDRTKQLYERNRSISLEQYEQSGTDAALAYQEYVQARIAEEYVKRRDRIVQAKARLDEADAAWRELIDRLEKYIIRAPFDGFVVAEHTEVGAWIREGEPVAEVVQLHPVEVRAFVPEKYVTQVEVGGEAVVRPQVPMSAERPLPVGRITGVVAEAEARSRTFAVKIQVENADYFLKAGMLAEVELAVGPKAPATLVPKDALYIDRRYPLPQVFLAVPDEKDPQKTTPLQVAVRTGASLGSWIAVEPVGATIEAGNLVVERGNERITAATKELAPTRQGATPPPE